MRNRVGTFYLSYGHQRGFLLPIGGGQRTAYVAHENMLPTSRPITPFHPADPAARKTHQQ